MARLQLVLLLPHLQVLKLKKWLVLMGWEHGMKPDEVNLRHAMIVKGDGAICMQCDRTGGFSLLMLMHLCKDCMSVVRLTSVCVVQMGELVGKFNSQYQADPSSFLPGVAGGVLGLEEAAPTRHSRGSACKLG